MNNKIPNHQYFSKISYGELSSIWLLISFHNLSLNLKCTYSGSFILLQAGISNYKTSKHIYFQIIRYKNRFKMDDRIE